MKLLITLSNEQGVALKELMAQDLLTNKSAFIASLIGAERKRRSPDKKPTA